APVSSYDIGDEIQLPIGKVAMGAVDLPVDIAGIDKEHGIGALNRNIFVATILTLSLWGRPDFSGRPYRFNICLRQFLFAFIKEPERTGQGYGIEKVGADGDNHIHPALFDHLLADGLFAVAGIGGRVGHHKTCSSALS